VLRFKKKKDPVFTNRHSVTFERNWIYINSAVRTPNIAVVIHLIKSGLERDRCRQHTRQDSDTSVHELPENNFGKH